MIVNFVISEDKSSKIFCDIFRRYLNRDDIEVLISEKPVAHADVYHYHRPQMETSLAQPSVVTVHHDLDDPDPFVSFEKFEERYREATRIICLNSLQEEILNRAGLDHTVIIPHGFDSKLFAKRPVRHFDPNQKINLGIVSKRYPRRFKGEAYLYELLDRLSPDKIAFTLIGEGRSEDALYLDSLGFEVECHESLPYRLYPAVYEKIDFLLMLSTFEGGPANIPEAVAAGTPILCTEVGMVRDMVIDGRNGIVMHGDARRDIAILDKIFTNDRGFYDDLMRGAQDVSSAPSWDEIIAKHLALYDLIAK